MSHISYNTIIMDNSQDPKNDDGQASAVRPDVDSFSSCINCRARNNRVRIAICESKSACCESNI